MQDEGGKINCGLVHLINSKKAKEYLPFEL